MRDTSSKIDNRVWHIAIYIRLSKEDGNDESMSIINQRKIILDYLENTFEGEFVIIDKYIDDGRTGTDYIRDDFLRMIADIEAGKVDCVICKTLSRMFRNYADQGYFLESHFPRFGVRFISLGEPAVDSFLHPEVITEGIELPINGVLNDRYAARTSADIRRTFDMKRRKGESIASFAPYGYAKDPANKNHLIIDKEAAEVVRNIFLWYIDGMSKSGIVRRLNELGIPNPSAYKHSKGLNFHNPHLNGSSLWCASTINVMMTNEVYIGNMVQGKQKIISYKVHELVHVPEEEWYVVEGTHEPIIDKETFDKAQALKKHRTRTAPEKREVYLFSGLIRCGECDRALYRRTSKGHVYYFCRAHNLRGQESSSSLSIREDELQTAVLEAIQKQIELVEDLSKVVDQINQAPAVCTKSKRLNDLLKQREKELQKITNITDNLYVDWKNGDISRTEYHHMKEKYTAQMEQLEQSVANLHEEIRAIEDSISNEEDYFENFLKYKNIQKLDRGILVALVEQVSLYEDKTIRIDFKFQDQYRRIAEFIEINNQDNTSGQDTTASNAF